MKRYKQNGDFKESFYPMEESNDGEWVKFEDVEWIRKLGFGRTNCGVCGADLSKGNHNQERSLVECNCDKASDNPRHRNDLRFDSVCDNDAWICPAHGYKRI